MELQINYDRRKVIQGLRYYFISQREVKLVMILVNVFAILSATLMAFRLISPMAFLFSSLFWLGLMIVFWFLMPWLVYRRNTTFQESIHLTFREKDMLLETAKGAASWLYSRFRFFSETPHFFHLHLTEKSFFLIPKDACTVEASTEAVRLLLTERVGKKQ